MQINTETEFTDNTGNIENEHSTDSSTEENNAEDTSSSTGNNQDDDSKELPWHKDPRFQQFVEDKNKFSKDLEELQAWKSQQEQHRSSNSEDIVVPKWFGAGSQDSETKELYKIYLDEKEQDLTKAEQRAYDRIKREGATQDKALQEANDWLEQSVREIETTYKTKVDRNKLLKTVMDEELIDSHGRWNYKAGYKLIAQANTTATTKKTDDLKKIAGADTTAGEAVQKDYITSEEFQNNPSMRPW